MEVAQRAEEFGDRRATASFLEPPSWREALGKLGKERMEASVEAYGGYDGAERRRVIAWPSGAEAVELRDYISEISVEGSSLAHRRILGTLTRAGLDRSKVGDVIVAREGERAAVAVHPSIELAAAHALTVAIGKRGSVEPSSGAMSDMAERSEIEAERVSRTVPSLRADALVAAATGESRTRAREMAEKGSVRVNWVEANPDDRVEIGDNLSVRGFGRVIVESAEPTRRGRFAALLALRS